MAKDRFHNAVRTALEKENWVITADPYQLSVGEVDFEIDLAAELIAAERAGEKIAVEIKSFISRSLVSDFHTALGQCINYQFALNEVDGQRNLYLAIPETIYQSFFQRRFVRSVIDKTQINLLIYEQTQEVIRQWL
ncbi:XisH family protein [Moorena sp. SIO3H5]|uniref:XisH family protein n=1 Tax=Moorena sp. SIO3H5 TaxID=2607834 RepID=UPI0013BB67D1|nr:XisH family protein [Moorena sp. SIO3H5]NEO72026.1 fatty-acid oxidation protein subunit alpha [Moorena sp. SIO3H5]